MLVWDITATFSFNSERKRMSVFVRETGRKFVLYMKGPEDALFVWCAEDCPMAAKTVAAFEQEALMTLVITLKESSRRRLTSGTRATGWRCARRGAR